MVMPTLHRALWFLLFVGSVSALSTLSSGKVLVAVATGRVGRLVVQELLSRENSTVTVRALVRDITKARDILPSSERLEVVKCDLSNPGEVKKACEGTDAAMWCATGFSDTSSPINKAIALFKLKFSPSQSIDIQTLGQIGSYYKQRTGAGVSGGVLAGCSQVIMCSSAGVTRPIWSPEKKSRYLGASDIPIVRLNPFNILDVKRTGEQVLRESGAKYTILRPTGLNDKWPSGRPILTQGDLAVGRTSRADLARLMVSLLHEPAAVQKTIECVILAGYPEPKSYDQQLNRLYNDEEVEVTKGVSKIVDIGETISQEALDIQYAILQQLVPGETLQPNQLAMGQSYEQLDKGQQGRLGKRGEENAPIVRD